jgi:hypothetical protein
MDQFCVIFFDGLACIVFSLIMLFLPHAFQFCGAHLFRKDIMKCIETIWLATVKTIWKERNKRVFDPGPTIEP